MRFHAGAWKREKKFRQSFHQVNQGSEPLIKQILMIPQTESLKDPLRNHCNLPKFAVPNR